MRRKFRHVCVNLWQRRHNQIDLKLTRPDELDSIQKSDFPAEQIYNIITAKRCKPWKHNLMSDVGFVKTVQLQYN